MLWLIRLNGSFRMEGRTHAPPSCPGLSRLRGRSRFGEAKARASTSFPACGPTWLAGTSPAMTTVVCGGLGSSLRGLRELRRTRQINHPQARANALGRAVLEADHGVDGNGGFALVDSVDDV